MNRIRRGISTSIWNTESWTASPPPCSRHSYRSPVRRISITVEQSSTDLVMFRYRDRWAADRGLSGIHAGACHQKIRQIARAGLNPRRKPSIHDLRVSHVIRKQATY